MSGKLRISKKTISAKIVTAIIACSFLISLLLGTASILKSTQFIKKEAVDKLKFMSESYANKFSEILKGHESTLNSMESIAISEFDMEKFGYETTQYLNEFERDMDAVIGQVIKTDEGIQGAYFEINPELKGGRSWMKTWDGTIELLKRGQVHGAIHIRKLN